MKITLSGIIIILLATDLGAQSWNLPNSRANNRFTSDLFVTQRPAMSMNGFDNADGGSALSQKTLGAKQILERTYGIGQSQVRNVEDVFILINFPSAEQLVRYASMNHWFKFLFG